MRLTVLLDEALVEKADEAARELGVSRSRLIAEALREYLKKRRQARITEQLNKAYADGPSPEERRLVRQMRTKLRALDPW